MTTLHSADVEQLSQRAGDLRVPLFDKIDFDRLLAWVEQQAKTSAAHGESVAPLSPKLDLCCERCGYGIVSRLPPTRCPMCGGDAVWAEPPGWANAGRLHERRAG